MEIYLNSKQAEKLADFLFDIAKGLILGGVGFAAVVPSYLKLFYVLLSSVFAFWCTKTALKLIEEI